MRFLNLLILSLTVVFGGAEALYPLKRVQSFEEISKQVIFAYKEFKGLRLGEGIGSQRDFKLNPDKTIVFIDLDDTLLSHDGRKTGTQTLLDPDAIMYINRWQNAGFQVAFLTSRAEDERATTVTNLTAVGIKSSWNIPLFITNRQPKGDWLLANQEEYLTGFEIIIHIDDKAHQLKSVSDKVCKGKTCHLLHFGQQADLVYDADRIPDSIKGFTQKATEAGGTHSTFILSDQGVPKFVLKKGENRIPQFKEEVMADGLYKAIGEADASFGIHVPPFKLFIQDGSYNRVTQFLPGAELGINRQSDVAKGFVVDAFMANWDLVVNGKNLWLSNDEIYRMDNGGSLRYRAIGKLKSTTGYDFSSAKCDIDTMRGINCEDLTTSEDGAKFYGHLTEADILAQIERLIPLKDKILETADKYNGMLHLDNYAELSSNLITRLDSLREYYYDHPQILTRYERAHPRRMVVPGKSSASILVYSDVDGAPKILLGKRVRHDWWGNFGGKADDGDQTLLNAAVRETQEESMGLFHFLKEGADGLAAAPSHDLIKGGDKPDALHRMYLAQHDFVGADQFKDSLATQTNKHSKEYTDFEWVDVQDLFALVEANLKTENDPKNEKQYALKDTEKEIYIHHPLMDMLRQQPVREWFLALIEGKTARKIHTQGSVGAKIQSFDQDGATFHLDKVRQRRIVANIPPISKKSQQAKSRLNQIKDLEAKRYPAPAFWDPRSERLEKLTHLTTKHMDVLTELKKLPKKKSIDEIKRTARHAHQVGYSTDNANRLLVSNPTLPARTATDAYLAFVLGNVYKTGADQENVFEFLKGHSSLSKSYAEEFSPNSPTCGAAVSYKCIVLDAMAKERAMHDWFTFYHTLPGKLGFIYDIATEFRNVLRLQGSDSMHSLRALDKFFKGLADVDAFIKDELTKQNKTDFTQMHNYEGTFQEKGLSVNVTLFGSKDVNTSSSFHMFHDNQTVSPPNYERFLAALLSEFGLLDTQKYFDLFDRYFGKNTRSIDEQTITETGENHLLQIFIHPDTVDSMVYLAGSMGMGLYGTLAEQKQKALPSTFLKQMRTNPQDADDLLKKLYLSDQKGGGLHRLQARIFMKPEFMTDDSKVKIIRYTKSAISQRYMADLKEMVRQDLKTWLDARYELQPDTLENPAQAGIPQALSPLQKVVRHMDQAEGKLYKTKTPEELYGKFLIDDNVEGIRQILARNPDFDLFKEIKNPDYTKSYVQTLTPFDLIIKTTKIKTELKQFLKKRNILIVENDHDLTAISNSIKEIYVIAAVENLDLRQATVLEAIILDSGAKIGTLTLPNSRALKKIDISGSVRDSFELDLSQATALEAIILADRANVGTLTLPDSPALKIIGIWGTVKSADLSQAKALEKIMFSRYAKVDTLTLPNSRALKKIDIWGEIRSVDLSQATALAEIMLGRYLKVETLTLPNDSSALKKIDILGRVQSADLSNAKALEKIMIGFSAKVDTLTLPNSRALKKIDIWGTVQSADLSNAKALEEIILGDRAKVSMLTLPDSPALKKFDIWGRVQRADLSKATALEEIILGRDAKVNTLTLPDSPALKKIVIWGMVQRADLSNATDLEAIILDDRAKVNTLTLPNSSALKKIDISGGGTNSRFKPGNRFRGNHIR